MIMVLSTSDSFRYPAREELEKQSLLGELVVQRESSQRPSWKNQVHFRRYSQVPLSPEKSYKWGWSTEPEDTEGLYHGIPGWTRFTLRRKNSSYEGYISRTASTSIGDKGDHVDNWDVLLTCLNNWATLDADLRTSCLERSSYDTRFGFVTQIELKTSIECQFNPMPGFHTAKTPYLFVEDLRVEADGHVAPCKHYWSLDRNGATPMSAGLLALYGVNQDFSWRVHRDVRFLDREQFAQLNELRTWLGAAEELQKTWNDAHPTLKRTHSATRLDKVDWRWEWDWEDCGIVEREIREFWLGGLPWLKKQRELEELAKKAEEEATEVERERSLVHRLARSKTKSVGGGLSLSFLRKSRQADHRG
ncbi:hypothetical protein B0H15DRAFT_797453 [Mycena belliarum]|uniref:Uncharacterized protein n=1 Tax=Mycena belliarum TaxID=1033014 RepID=A0AAD6XRY6_9AGAR|nr:hypothetical protein B0H15DRAFT_797453 [Mycena belliae]